MFRNMHDAAPESSGEPRDALPRHAPHRHVLLSGGGSGGHVFPALAVADALAGRGWTVSYAGASRGIEARLVAERGLPFYPLPARPLVGRGRLAQVGALLTLARSGLTALRLVRKLGVDVVVGTGGYGAAPAVLGARLARRPALLVEPNAQTGVANRMLARFANEAAIAYPTTADQLRCPSTVTGVPVRRAFFDSGPLPPAPPKGPWRLLVLGGSQGAQQLNELVPAALSQWPVGADSVQVVHQCGAARESVTQEYYSRTDLHDGIGVEVVRFIDDVAAAMASSHVVISRAGAITLAELCAAARPSLLVPLTLANGHQRDNAAVLVRAGAARMLDGAGASPQDMAAVLDGMLDLATLQSMSDAARALAHADAAAKIADRVEVLVDSNDRSNSRRCV